MITNYKIQTSSSSAISRDSDKPCGWWCRNWKKVAVAVATVVAGPVAGGVVALAVNTLADINIFGKGLGYTLDIEDKEVSDAEAGIIRFFLDNYFFPTYEKLLLTLDKIETTSNVETQLLYINDVLKTMAVYKQYVATVNDQNLSADGFALKRDFVANEFKLIEDYIATILNNANIKVEQYTVKIDTTNNYLHTRLHNKLTSVVYALVYRSVSSGSINVSTDIPTDSSQLIGANNPDPATSENDTTTTPTTNILKTSGLNWFLVALATFGLYKVATKKKSKK